MKSVFKDEVKNPFTSCGYSYYSEHGISNRRVIVNVIKSLKK